MTNTTATPVPATTATVDPIIRVTHVRVLEDFTTDVVSTHRFDTMEAAVQWAALIAGDYATQPGVLGVETRITYTK